MDPSDMDTLKNRKLEDKVYRKYRNKAFDGSKLINPDAERRKSLSSRRFERSNRYLVSYRFLYGLLTFIYVLIVIVFYSVPYVFFGRDIPLASLYGALLAWNSFKPLLIYAVIFSITQQRLAMFTTFILGGFAGFVIIGTFVLQIVVLHDIFITCNGETNPTHPCNDPLYCCVYYDSVPYCQDKGPCLGVNTTDLNIPGHTSGASIDITKGDLLTNDNYKLMAYVLAVLFVLEVIFVRYFTNMLYTINSGYSFIMDTTVEYEYPKKLPRRYGPTLNSPIGKDDGSFFNTPEAPQTTTFTNIGGKNQKEQGSGATTAGLGKGIWGRMKPSQRCGSACRICSKVSTLFICIKRRSYGAWRACSDFLLYLLDTCVVFFNNVFLLKSEQEQKQQQQQPQHPTNPVKLPPKLSKNGGGGGGGWYDYKITNLTHMESRDVQNGTNRRRKKKNALSGSRLMYT